MKKITFLGAIIFCSFFITANAQTPEQKREMPPRKPKVEVGSLKNTSSNNINRKDMNRPLDNPLPKKDNKIPMLPKPEKQPKMAPRENLPSIK